MKDYKRKCNKCSAWLWLSAVLCWWCDMAKGGQSLIIICKRGKPSTYPMDIEVDLDDNR